MIRLKSTKTKPRFNRRDERRDLQFDSPKRSTHARCSKLCFPFIIKSLTFARFAGESTSSPSRLR